MAWALWALASVTQVSVENAREGVPAGEGRGVSLVPFVPIFPLAMLGVAWFINTMWPNWGTYSVGAFHAVFGAVLLASIRRAQREIEAINRQASSEQSQPG